MSYSDHLSEAIIWYILCHAKPRVENAAHILRSNNRELVYL